MGLSFVVLPSGGSAACYAGLLCLLPAEAGTTNKPLSGPERL